ncbi:MAG: hypothetical protein ACUVRS_06225 [Armatimonadota bacterium]
MNQLFETNRLDEVPVAVQVIRGLSAPVIHYKVLGGGRNDPREAFAFAARHLRPGDAVCVGIYDEHKPDMLADDVKLFEQAVSAVK